MDDIQLIIGTVVILLGVWIGGNVAKKSGFIYPWDFVTIPMVAICMVYGIIAASKVFVLFDPVWILPFLCGYLVGYCLIGLTQYTMFIYQNFGNKVHDVYPVVLVQTEEGTVMYEQSWGALWDRWAHGIQHKVESYYPLDADWETKRKNPAFPRFRNMGIYIENKPEVTYRVVKKGRFRELREYTTYIIVARASYLSKARLATEERLIFELQVKNDELMNENRMLKLQQGPAMMEMAIAMDIEADKQTPANRMQNLIKLKKGFEIKKKAEQEAERMKQDDIIKEQEAKKDVAVNG